MNKQEQEIKKLLKIIKEKNIIIDALMENSDSQTLTNKVILIKLKKQQTELDNIKLTINLN